MFPEVSVCSTWATIADVCGPCAAYDFPTAPLEAGLLVASEILYYLTGMVWPGECVDTVRPCAERSVQVRAGGWAPSSSTAWGYCGCHADSSCGCSTLSVIRLPRRPVTSVVSVKLDGLVLDPTFYRVDDWHRLTYLPGAGDTRQGWPCCQRLDLPATELDTMEVVYAYGSGPGLGGVQAAAALGCEFALATQGSSACRLPRRLNTITRQGVTMTFLNDLNALRDGWTELPEVDAWLAAVRYGRAHRPPAVFNPDRTRAHRRTTG